MNKHIIYLAAGNSRRFGSNKLLHIYGGKPLYRHGLDMLTGLCRNRPDCSLMVVSQYPEILEYARREGIFTVYSPDSSKGMSYTIKAAVGALENAKEEDFLLFVVADQPYLTAHTVTRILECAAPGVEGVSAAFRERPGNPVLFSARLIPALLSLQGDEGGRRALRGHSCTYVAVEDERELYDIDMPENQYLCSGGDVAGDNEPASTSNII